MFRDSSFCSPGASPTHDRARTDFSLGFSLEDQEFILSSSPRRSSFQCTPRSSPQRPRFEPTISATPAAYDLNLSIRDAFHKATARFICALTPINGVLRASEAAWQALIMHFVDRMLRQAHPAVFWSLQGTAVACNLISSTALAALYTPSDKTSDTARRIALRVFSAFSYSTVSCATSLYVWKHGGRSPFALMMGILLRHHFRQNGTIPFQKNFPGVYVNTQPNTDNLMQQERLYLPHASQWINWSLHQAARLNHLIDSDGENLKKDFLEQNPIQNILGELRNIALSEEGRSLLNPGPLYFPWDRKSFDAPSKNCQMPLGRFDNWDEEQNRFCTGLEHSMVWGLQEQVLERWQTQFGTARGNPAGQQYMPGEEGSLPPINNADLRALRVVRSITLDLITHEFHLLMRMAPTAPTLLDRQQYLTGWILAGVPSMAAIWTAIIKPKLLQVQAGELIQKVTYAGFQDFFPEIMNILSKCLWPLIGTVAYLLRRPFSSNTAVLTEGKPSIYPAKNYVKKLTQQSTAIGSCSWESAKQSLLDCVLVLTVPLLNAAQSLQVHSCLLLQLACETIRGKNLSLLNHDDKPKLLRLPSTQAMSAEAQTMSLPLRARAVIRPRVTELFGYKLPLTNTAPMSAYAPAVVRMLAVQTGINVSLLTGLLLRAFGVNLPLYAQGSSRAEGIWKILQSALSTMSEDRLTYPGCDRITEILTANWRIHLSASGNFEEVDQEDQRDRSDFGA